MRSVVLMLLFLGCGGSSATDAAQQCTADCECASLCCDDGVCSRQCGRRGLGLCGADCACNDGTCDERRCCILGDGTIAEPFSQECTYLDGAQVDGGQPDAPARSRQPFSGALD